MPKPTWLSLLFVSLGWGSLIASVALVTSIRAWNLRSGFFALEGKVEEARKLDVKKDRHTTCASNLLIAGMIFIMLAGAVSLWVKIGGGK